MKGSDLMKKKGFIAEFKEFISRGSVIDLAVGIIIGGAFTAITASWVNDVVMPAIGILFGGVDFTGLKLVVTPEADGVAEAAVYYGRFIQSVVNFFLVAFVIFCLIKGLNSLRKEEVVEEAPAAPAPPPEDIQLLMEIRDLLKQQGR